MKYCSLRFYPLNPLNYAVTEMDKVFDVIIIGAGPSGLAAANSCRQKGLDFLVLEMGANLFERSYDNPIDVVKGVGGAGLFSDGKLSYYPSGHNLYTLSHLDVIGQGYDWFHNIASEIIIDRPKFPDFHDYYIKESEKYLSGPFFEKNYTSICLSSDDLRTILNRMLIPVASHLRVKEKVVSILKTEDIYEIVFKSCTDRSESVAKAYGVVYCGGRFGPMLLNSIYPSISTEFNRIEYGIRIEQKQKDFFVNSHNTVDTKLICESSENGVEYRTFCCCRGGSVIKSEFEGIKSYSGMRAHSDFSNIGFNVRISNYEQFVKLFDEIKPMLSGSIGYFECDLNSFANISENFGSNLGELLRVGLKKLIDEYNIKTGKIYGPTIEGVGLYPKVNDSLQIINDNSFFLAGDSVGVFRGLLPAIVSGYYAASILTDKIEKKIKNRKINIKIKQSSTEEMRVIFTAQSKKYFYCRDVVCEYILNKKMLPINPFRVFDYFLSDRVDRDLIRQGNNHLIKMCDELWVFGPISDGVLFEIFLSLDLGKPIKFFKIGAKVDEIKLIKRITDIAFEPEIHLVGNKKIDLLRRIEGLFINGDSMREQLTLL